MDEKQRRADLFKGRLCQDPPGVEMNQTSKYFAKNPGTKTDETKMPKVTVKKEEDDSETDDLPRVVVKAEHNNIQESKFFVKKDSVKTEDDKEVPWVLAKTEDDDIDMDDIPAKSEPNNNKTPIRTEDSIKPDPDNEGDQPYWPNLHPPEGPFWSIDRVRRVVEARESGMSFQQIAVHLSTHPMFRDGKLPSAGKLRIVYNRATGKSEVE